MISKKLINTFVMGCLMLTLTISTGVLNHNSIIMSTTPIHTEQDSPHE